MSVLSRTAIRFIALALDETGDHRRKAAWHAWSGDPAQALSPYLAQVALHALSGFALRLEDRVGEEGLDPTVGAQIENDLGYIIDVEEARLEYLQHPVTAYG
jgi:hypothetical protein